MQHHRSALHISLAGKLDRAATGGRGRAAALIALALTGACARGAPAASPPGAAGAPAATGQAPAAGLTITYLGNEGFLLAADDQRVLVDALYGTGMRGQARLPEAERARRESASPPFDRVALVLATHRHPDHFQAAAVAAYLRASPDAHFLSTDQVVAAPREHGDDAGVAPRVTGMRPRAGEQVPVELAGVKLRVMSMTHGADLPIDNLGFAIQLGAATVLHVGDTVATAAELAPFDSADSRPQEDIRP